MRRICASIVLFASVAVNPASASEGAVDHKAGIELLSRVRDIGGMCLSPDRKRFAVQVRAPNPDTNAINAEWLIGSVLGGNTTRLATSVIAGPMMDDNGYLSGDLEFNPCSWSPDGRFIAVTSSTGTKRQLIIYSSQSRSGGIVVSDDARDFAWIPSSAGLYFTSKSYSGADKSFTERGRREGFRYSSDLWQISDVMLPTIRRRSSGGLTINIFHIHKQSASTLSSCEKCIGRDVLASLETIETGSFGSFAPNPTLAAGKDGANPVDTATVEAFQRSVGVGNSITEIGIGNVASETDRVTFRSDINSFQHCEIVATAQFLCIEQGPLQPQRLVTIEPTSGRLKEILDINPEFEGSRFGSVRRIEWDVPRLAKAESIGEAFAGRTYGFLILPPNFDPGGKYPLFIDPYEASGFFPVGRENPLQVYSMSGIAVLRTSRPKNFLSQRFGSEAMKIAYSPELGFPLLTTYTASVRAGLEAALSEGFVDPSRIGMGGLSAGSLITYYFLQKFDLLAAASVGSPNWSHAQYYGSAPAGHRTIVSASVVPKLDEWMPAPDVPANQAFWTEVDTADHVNTIEAPLLFNLSAQEGVYMSRMLRIMSDRCKVFDGYIFDKETHQKWQPEHLRTIMLRNLYWFQHWLKPDTFEHSYSLEKRC
jgi:hypothetical protein